MAACAVGNCHLRNFLHIGSIKGGCTVQSAMSYLKCLGLLQSGIGCLVVSWYIIL